MTQLVEELRRRGVLKTAAMYAAGAWLLTEVSATMLPALHFPEWSLTAVVLLVLLGFPVTMILTWIFDVGPDGITRTAPLNRKGKLTFALAGIALIASTAVLVVLVFPDKHNIRESMGPSVFAPMANSVAVLPFEDTSRDRSQGYLVDGLADTLMTRLGQVDNVTVIARTSAFAYKDQDIDARLIGKQLNVGAVLDGSLQRSGDTVRIVAQLVNTQDGTQLWSQTFDRPAIDIFKIQDEISDEVAEALVGKIVSNIDSVATRHPALDAYELYLLGRHNLYKRTTDSIALSIDYFEQAIEQDPEYAPAYTGLANAYEFLIWYGNVSKNEYIQKAEPLLGKALLLDDRLPETHAALGNYYRSKFEYKKSEDSYRRAIELNPNFAMAYMWYGMSLRGMGRYRDSLVSTREATRLDPKSFKAQEHAGFSHFLVGQITDALAQYELAMKLQPNHADTYYRIGEIMATTGKLDDGIRYMTKAASMSSGRYYFARDTAGYYVDLGRPDLARQWLDQALDMASDPDWLHRQESALMIAQDDYGNHKVLAGQLVQRKPDEAWAIRALAFAEFMDADFVAAKMNYKKALSAGAQAFGFVYDSFSTEAAFEDSLNLAHAYLQTGETEKGEQLLAMTSVYVNTLRNEGLVMPALDYVEASVYSLLGDEDTGIAALQRAVDAGWRRHWWMTRDPNLANLRNNPDFKRMLDYVESELERMRQHVAVQRFAGSFD